MVSVPFSLKSFANIYCKSASGSKACWHLRTVRLNRGLKISKIHQIQSTYVLNMMGTYQYTYITCVEVLTFGMFSISIFFFTSIYNK